MATTSSLPTFGIHGAPRSGTTWLGQIFNSHPAVAYRFQPFFSHAFRGQVDASSGPVALRAFFAALARTQDDFILQRGAARLSSSLPVFMKSAPSLLVYKEVRFHHLLPFLLASLPEFRALGIVRDPRAVLASWAAAPREFDHDWSLRDEWRDAERKNAGLEENWYGFERWKQLAGLFLALQAQYPDRFMLVRYENLAADPGATTRALLRFAGLDVTEQTAGFLVRSTTLDDGDPYGVHRDAAGKAIARTEQLPVSIADTIGQELSGTSLARFLAE